MLAHDIPILVDLIYTMSNQKGNVVGRLSYSLLKYKVLKPAS